MPNAAGASARIRAGSRPGRLNAGRPAFYSLRVFVYMYMREPETESPPVRHGLLVRGGLLVAGVMTIVLGMLPNWPVPVLDAAKTAAQAIATLGGAAFR